MMVVSQRMGLRNLLAITPHRRRNGRSFRAGCSKGSHFRFLMTDLSKSKLEAGYNSSRISSSCEQPQPELVMMGPAKRTRGVHEKQNRQKRQQVMVETVGAASASDGGPCASPFMIASTVSRGALRRKKPGRAVDASRVSLSAGRR
jgi:hypothetical protein